ncbi:MAG: pilus assembly protein PilM [Candidatus Omnitrophota bacterium]
MIIFEINDKYVKMLWGWSILRDIQITGVVYRELKSDSPDETQKVVSSLVNEKMIKKFGPFVLCIPRDQIILRNLQFPAKDEKELEDIISLHLTQEVPYSREEIIYDYSVLERTSAGFTSVLLGIIHRQKLIKQVSIFEKLGLYPENVLLSTFGLMNFISRARMVKTKEKDNADRLKACLDISDKTTDFFVFRKNQLLFSKSISMGVKHLKEEDKLVKFTGEIKQALVVSRAARGESLAMLYISGVEADWSALEKKINNDLQVPVEIVNSMEVVESLEGVKEIKQILGNTSVSALLGSAMDPLSDKFNLVLPEVKVRKDVREMTKNLFMGGGIVIYLLVLLLVGFMGKMYSRQAYLDKLIAEINKTERANKSAMKALDKIKAVKNFTNYKDSILYYYYELSKITTNNITVERLIFVKKKEFSLMGEGMDMGEIFKFVRDLNDAKIFGKAELRYSRKATDGKSEQNEFNIVCHIK